MALALVASASVVGCSSASSGGAGDGTGSSEPAQAPAFEPGQGQAAGGRLHPYPAGPYGVGLGSVIPNFKFYGYTDYTTNKTAQLIELADLYNPTGKDTYADGSGYPVGNAKPKMVAIAIGAVWCGPCNDEARNVLPGAHTRVAPLGGQLFYVLAEGATGGVPATQTDLNGWDNRYKLNYPSVIDPSASIQEVFPASAFPTNLVIDTTKMTIVTKVSGEPDTTYWDAMVAKLNAMK